MNDSTPFALPLWFSASVLVCVAVIPYVVILFLSPDTLFSHFGEDQLFEWLSACAWLAASLLFFCALLKVLRRGGVAHPIWYLGLTAICFIAAGEEISWGQRLLNYETPALIAESNLQGEMNLHNLQFLDVRTAVDGENKTGLQRWLTFGRIGSLIWMGFLILLPLASRFIPVLGRLFAWLRLPVPPVPGAYIGFVGYAAFLAVDALNGPVPDGAMMQSVEFAVKFAINEYKETLVAMLFLLAAAYLLRREYQTTAT